MKELSNYYYLGVNEQLPLQWLDYWMRTSYLGASLIMSYWTLFSAIEKKKETIILYRILVKQFGHNRRLLYEHSRFEVWIIYLKYIYYELQWYSN